jgi:hypothetical protein
MVSSILIVALGAFSNLTYASQTEIIINVTPSATGNQIVRYSIPFPSGFVSENQNLVVLDGSGEIDTGFRPLTFYPAGENQRSSVRRGILTFPYKFPDMKPVRFSIRKVSGEIKPEQKLQVDIVMEEEKVILKYENGPGLEIHLLAPPRLSPVKSAVEETVESNTFFLWKRFHLNDAEYPRIIEMRADALGTVVLVAHLQRNQPDHGRAPDFGWQISTISTMNLETQSSGAVNSHSFSEGEQCKLILDDGRYRVYHPAGPFKRRGKAEILRDEEGNAYKYWRCRSEEKVPMQQAAWRRAEIVIAPSDMALLSPSLQYMQAVDVDSDIWNELYATGQVMDLDDQPILKELLKYHRDAIIRSAAQGDDWGNITSYSDSRNTGSIYGMNRLNHCPAIFEEGYRSGDHRLIETAIQWCDNFYDQSIWWGPNETGGTRYNNISSWKGGAPDNLYMWRSNRSVNFCTKGYDSFFIAFEQTGDPRMMEALKAQIEYASEHVHTDQGEARNIGDVRDFMRLYQFTGEKRYLDEAMRLFRELRTKLSEGDLFSQSGRPILPDIHFIDDDQVGYKYPFAKPYIIGYALSGLPELLKVTPEEPKLRDVIQAVADFMAESQDPAGGWRYPHPRSSGVIMSQAMEHAWQIVQADKVLGFQEKHLDAVERVLRQRLHGWLKTGQIFSGLRGWELSTEAVKERDELYELYQKPDDRDFMRDHAEGTPGFGGSAPEGIVYFPEVLAFYLNNRPVSRLMEPPDANEPLGKILLRVPDKNDREGGK